MSEAPLHVVDGSVYFFRGLFGLPDVFFDQRQRSVNGVKGYLHFVFDLIAQDQARFVVVAFDESLNTCFRNALYQGYKADRPLPDDNILYQLQVCRQITSALGILTLAHAQYEADDIIATLVARARRPVAIYSRDKDLLQLLRGGVTLATPVAGVRTESEFVREYGFSPALFPDFQALQGDSVDNIPGVPGVGAKTAQRLVARFGSLEAIYASVADWPAAGVGGHSRQAHNLLAHRSQALLFRQLTRLRRRTPLDYATRQLQMAAPCFTALRTALQRAGLWNHFAAAVQRLERC